MSTPTKWSLEPLLHGHLPNDVSEGIFADISFVRFAFAAIISMSLLYPIMHKLLLKTCKNYKSLKNQSKQIVVIHHAVEFIVLFSVLPFYTYFVVRGLFRESNPGEAIADAGGALRCGVFILLQYAFELSSRFEQPRPIVVFHHVLALVDMTLCAFFSTSVVLKTGIILVYAICFEGPTFLGLFLYRMLPNHPVTPKVILVGMVVFGITRPIQCVLVGAIIFGHWNEENVMKWQSVVQLVVTILLTTVQFLTLKIHYGVWQRCIAKKRKNVAEEIENTNYSEVKGSQDIENSSSASAGPSDST